MKSIVQDREDGCLICGNPYVEEHHIFFGTANRKLSEKYGLKAYLCQEHHRGRNGVHFDKNLDSFLKRIGRERFREEYPTLDFREIFGKEYE